MAPKKPGPWDEVEGKCNARKKDGTGLCRQNPTKGRKRCRSHGGGKGDKPIGRPPTHGKNSAAYGRFTAALEAAKNDPEVWDIRKPLAALELHLQEVAKRASKGDSPEMRQQALELAWALEREWPAEAPTPRSLEDLVELLSQGVNETRQLEAFAQAAERLGQRLDRAWDVRLRATNVINARDVEILFGRLIGILYQHLEPKVVSRVVDAMEREGLPKPVGAS